MNDNTDFYEQELKHKIEVTEKLFSYAKAGSRIESRLDESDENTALNASVVEYARTRYEWAKKDYFNYVKRRDEGKLKEEADNG